MHIMINKPIRILPYRSAEQNTSSEALRTPLLEFRLRSPDRSLFFSSKEIL